MTIRPQKTNNVSTDCDKSGDASVPVEWRGFGWYRFLPPAGTMMPLQSPGQNHCGTHASGWIDAQSNPNTPGEIVDRKVCFAFFDFVQMSVDNCTWSTDIRVRNCGTYLLYELPDTDGCHFRYCGT